MTPCGSCLNCLNGAKALCLRHFSAVEANETPRAHARNCRCGKLLFGKRRFCSECRRKRNTETARVRMRRLRSRHVTKNPEKDPVNIG